MSDGTHSVFLHDAYRDSSHDMCMEYTWNVKLLFKDWRCSVFHAVSCWGQRSLCGLRLHVGSGSLYSLRLQVMYTDTLMFHKRV